MFFVSGFCSLLYQSVWLRLAYASFGINSQVMSIVISVFMLGLALGSWGTGSFISRFIGKHKINILYIYGLAELGIGAGAFAVPQLFLAGRDWLLLFGQINSLAYLGLSALIVAIIMLPWCFLMGATIPLMIEFFSRKITKDKQIFSYLYLANTAGAITGVVVSVFILIELFGFRGTLFIAAVLNAIIFFASLFISSAARKFKETESQAGYQSLKQDEDAVTLPILFLTGFISLGLEVIWMRMFTPIVKTNVYSFAIILFLYLLGTTAGLWKYRYDKKILSTRFLLAALVFSLLAQIFINEPQFNLRYFGIFVSIFSFSCILGYLTPKQIDEKAKGSSAAVGTLYAVNIAGCIAGPLVASYILLPLAGAKFSIILLCLPFRSVMSWGIDAAAVELVPSVKELFPYFFSDADIINQNPRGRIVIDDGRRYLQRSGQIYDLITIDPPPPVQAAGSSLLYSKDFYEIAKKHLSDKGILAQWYPEKEDETLNAVARSLTEVFPYVTAYRPLEGQGYHLLASKSPINSISPEEFLQAMPSEAKKDMLEWNDKNLSDLQYAQSILAGKTDIDELLNNDKGFIIDDNKPFNEYYFLRKYTPFLSE